MPENFDWPYLRTNITEFWRHWHMSLTSWLIDYIYIPLGGSRGRSGQVYANILVTMLVSGIWHGAGVNFIVWGLVHGVMLVIRRGWRRDSSHARERRRLSVTSGLVAADVRRP